ncbi:hypothetical protein D1BOALGB6SA_8991 [Olavius sp. associated proteobacterium Delta 1]|nr:hypothetical protein D1BOALGB6SA_8991 [Olavius sp. associated proteobacterium Delta 1]
MEPELHTAKPSALNDIRHAICPLLSPTSAIRNPKSEMA